MALLVVVYSLTGGQKWLSAAGCQTSDSRSVEAFEVQSTRAPLCEILSKIFC